MQMVEGAMEGVKLGAKDFAELQAIITMRALYKPRDRVLTPEETQKVNKSFQIGLQACGDDPRIQEGLRLVEEYNDALRASGCTDRDVRENLMPSWKMALRTVRACVEVLLFFIPAAICLALFAPVGTISFIMAKREMATALAGSSVKVKALDVVASYKIIVCLVFVPIYNLLLTVGAVYLLQSHDWTESDCWLFGGENSFCESVMSYEWSTSNCWLIGVTIYFVVLPLWIFGGCLLCDHFFRVCAECRTAILRVCGSTRSMLETRSQLQLTIRALVEELGPKVMSDFNQNRVVTQADISADNKALVDAGLVKDDTSKTPRDDVNTPLLNRDPV
jgi:glycerol-3-phosphate O-acyltransferase/dihydroxyacetone phosphate acyltransferase